MNRETLKSVLDEVIPVSQDGRLPGAGELGLASEIEQALLETPALVPAIEQGLAALEQGADRRGSCFAELEPRDKLDVMNEVAAAQPALLPSLVFHCYVRYYQHPRVVEALGLEARPPHPKGYELAMGDLTLLDAVRDRPKVYRNF